MTPFLQLVASDLRKKFGNNLSHLKVVFPNKRAKLFFNDYLVIDDTPVWAPTYLTINELFYSFSSLRKVESIETVCLIYNIYTELIKREEEQEVITLDFFYGWGEMILSDFEDIDKNLSDAYRIFTNVSDYQNIDFGNFLTPEQIAVVQHFFNSFSEESSSKIRERFLRLWNKLYTIYERLNTLLEERGLAYEGALFRKALTTLKQGNTTLAKNEIYVFVGFNVLDKVEKELFTYLKKQNLALFYWDYDTYYVKEHPELEAGRFVRENLLLFPNALPETLFSNFSQAKSIEIVAAASNNIQAAAIAPWLNENLTKDPKRTAIIICDENQLLPVLHNIPENVHSINITKGFPLTQTPAYTLIEKFFRNEEQNPTHTVEELLDSLQEEIKVAGIKERDTYELSAKERTTEIWHELYSEAYYQSYLIINLIIQIVRQGLLDTCSTPTLRRLIRQLIRQTSIPFHGEPATGLQIMGVLETRNLDFDNLLMLSVNENILPKKAQNSSFIPYFLRKEFGLDTYEKKTSVFSYYFYRLLQRASQIRLSYNNASDGLQKGEPSRFITQLLVESGKKVHHILLNSQQHVTSIIPQPIDKPSDLLDRIQSLSPSAINSYLTCQLKFYYIHILRLETPPPAPEDFEANQIGSLFHKAAELFYKDKCTKEGLVTSTALESFLQLGGESLLNPYIEQAYEEIDNPIQRNALVNNILRTFLSNLIKYDSTQSPFIIKSMEERKYMEITFPYHNGEHTICIGGIIDRLDIVHHPQNGTELYRIFDYKTGKKNRDEDIDSLDKLFSVGFMRPKYTFQTILYCLTLYKENPKHQYTPALFYTGQAHKKDYHPYLSIERNICYNVNEYLSDFENKLKDLLTELFTTIKDGSKVPFIPTEDTRSCEFCDFKYFCYRG